MVFRLTIQHMFNMNRRLCSLGVASLHTGCGQLVSIEEQQSTILNGLPPKFDHVVSIITISQVPFDLQGIATALLDVEAKQQAHFSHVSFSANFVEADNTSSTSSNLLGYAGHPPP
ncbi:hypothetical protein GOBAR_AA01045 [Gossypium barbadense]|uniref:Uncharacterized protein n=1 Tax=Gossypium barbadense TaxID=3634 RepID=A0A2P5YVC9_GOSBA|nr:hypothetical protein GOBAR_AA01045 [Gossypium barbadense]